ncbi:MAG: tetratricopeptide repeat protein [Cyanobium sp.]
MSEPQPIRFLVPEEGLDLSLLPEAARQRGSEAFREAVTRYYKDAYREAGGRVDVAFAEGEIEMAWEPQAGQVPASATINEHLQAGRYDEAIPLLRTRLQLEPDHALSLYNLGMVYSDRMQLSEARELLGRAVALEPGDANAQVALGIAALRDNDPEAAQGPLEKAVVLEPRNPFALRTLGQLHLMKGDAPAALPHLRAAAAVAADDPIILFTYAQCLLAIEGESHEVEADALFQRALRLAPVGDLAEKIKNQQRRLADRVMRANAKGMPRMDAVMYLSSALEAYRALEAESQKQLLAEAAAVGQKGLAINDPDQMHQLRQYQGGVSVSALQVACIYYVGGPAAAAWARRGDRLREGVRAGQGDGGSGFVVQNNAETA